MHFTPFPQLSTERLVLRELTLEDAPEILILRSDDQVNEFIDRPRALSIDNAVGFIERILHGTGKDQWLYWAISLKEQPGLVGTVCLWHFNPETQQAELGYELLPAFQGQGFMREAVSRVIRYGFDDLGLQVIIATPHRDNAPSRHLLERLNFTLDVAQQFEPPEDPAEELYFLRK